MKLQDFSFLKSQYERPNQKKICGGSVKSCQLGPDASGHCTGRYECIPNKKGDRWHCSRAAQDGGSCEQGPSPEGVCCKKMPPCVPVESTRNKRGGVVRWFVAVMVFLIAAILLSDQWQSLIDPGELSSKHSFKGQECSNCHASEGSLLSNAMLADDPHQANGLCLDCHEINDFPSAAHNRHVVKARLLNDTAKPKEKVLACVQCHKEHKGKDADMLALKNSQCESCHVKKHPDFATEHPEFKNYPHTRRTRIVFDHSKHEKKHFKKKKLLQYAPEQCGTCHQPDDSKRAMKVEAFDQSCSDCHQKDTTAERLADKGITLIGIPFVDTDSLAESGLYIGEWPATLEDQEIPSFTLALLAQDASLEKIIGRLQDNENPLSLADLSEADEETKALVVRLIWSLKKLLLQVQEKGSAAITEASQDKWKNGDLTLFDRLIDNELKAIVKQWLPNLSAEANAIRVQRATASTLVDIEPLYSESAFLPGTWRNQGFSLQYRSSGHSDKNLVRWLDMSANQWKTGKNSDHALFKQLSAPKAPGQCVKCHSADEQSDGSLQVNWLPKDYGKRRYGLTHFNHKPHLNQSDIDGCETCHISDDNAEYEDSYNDYSVETFASNYQPIEKKLCADCHTEQNVGQSCQSCHYYHFVETSPTKNARDVVESLNEKN